MCTTFLMRVFSKQFLRRCPLKSQAHPRSFASPAGGKQRRTDRCSGRRDARVSILQFNSDYLNQSLSKKTVVHDLAIAGERKMLFWWNFQHWLHRKLSKWLAMQAVMKNSSKWQYFRFNYWLTAAMWWLANRIDVTIQIPPYLYIWYKDVLYHV